MEVSRFALSRFYSWLMKFTHRVPPRPAQWTAVGVVAVAIFLLFPVTSPAILRWAGGTFQHHTFTAMWAVDPNRAMVGYSAGDRAVVAVQNQTGRVQNYHWRATCSRRKIANDWLQIPKGGTRYITLRTRNCPTNKMTVRIQGTNVWVSIKYITVARSTTTTAPVPTSFPLLQSETTTTVPATTSTDLVTTTTLPETTTSSSTTTTVP